MKKSLLIAIVVIVVIAVVVALILMRGSVVQQSGEASKEGLRVQVLESKSSDAVRVKATSMQIGGQTYASYGLYYRDNGYAYLVKLRVSNDAKETYGIAYRLITDRGQYDMTISCTAGVYTESLPTDPKYRELFEKAVEVEAGKLYGLDVSSIAISPGSTLEYYVVFCIPRGETPQKIHVLARTLEGKVVEFDVNLK